MTATEDWERELVSSRDRKDEFFADDPHSPLPEETREEFEGLRYFEPDPALRFEVPLDEHDEQARVTVETTTGGEQAYRRWGEFAVEIDGVAATLHAYKSAPEEPRLWVPFRDETNGEATYGGGRYLDLEAPDDRVDGRWVLDFNRAYNPYCAYSEAYECPLVPVDNWLDVPIRAGEKRPDLPGSPDEH
jgi:uncharacterized protein (DUF1684 family)